MEIRVEKPEDIAAIRQVNIAAFGRAGEANLVDQLRGSASTFSFVAVESGQAESEEIVGHVFFSLVAIAGDCAEDFPILGLAPVAVLPTHQRRGIGSRLIRHGLAAGDRLGYKAVVVLGWPDYYPSFVTTVGEKIFKCHQAAFRSGIGRIWKVSIQSIN